jgi:Starch binding domain
VQYALRSLMSPLCASVQIINTHHWVQPTQSSCSMCSIILRCNLPSLHMPQPYLLPVLPVRSNGTLYDMQLQLGEDLRIVGDCPELGNWDANSAPSLLLCRDALYRRLRMLPKERMATFKIVKVLQGGALDWESGDNRQLTPQQLSNDGLVVDVAFSGIMRVLEGTPETMQVRE